MNVATLLRDRALQAPDRIAILDRGGKTPRSITFAELDAAASLAATHAQRSGLRPGDRIVVLHPMNLDLYVALAGFLRAGLVPTFCDPGAGRATVRRGCARVEPAAVFGSRTGLAYAATIPALMHLRGRFTPQTLARSLPDCALSRDVAARDDDAALITFTSGSTGVPKVVVRSHAVLRAQLDAIRAAIPPVRPEIATMPIALLANLASGATSVIPSVDLRRPGNADPERLADDVAWSGAASIVASPAMLERLLESHARGRLATLQRIVSGGAPVMPRLMYRLQALVPGAEILAVYGSTEAEPIAAVDLAAISSADVAAMRGGAGLLAGRIVPRADARIVDGEILVAGDHVVPGYLGGEGDAETKVRFEERIWHRTGDGGYFDDEGRLWLTGRTRAEIRDRRGTLHPFAIECALSFHPKVARSALACVDGRRVVAIEPMLRRRIGLRRIERMLQRAGVDEVRVLRRIPVDRRHNAKVDYPALQRALASRPPRWDFRARYSNASAVES